MIHGGTPRLLLVYIAALRDVCTGGGCGGFVVVAAAAAGPASQMSTSSKLHSSFPSRKAPTTARRLTSHWTMTLRVTSAAGRAVLLGAHTVRS